jgi:nitrous oxidase accessory protein
VKITGADVTLQGFTVRGTGTSLDHEDTAILVDTGRVNLIDNRVEDALFGIYLKTAHGSVVRGNTVHQKSEIDVARRGDGMRVWYSNDVVIEDNVARDGRDVILWYSNNGVVRNNNFDRNRYGLHLMFSNDTLIEGNALNQNSIGLFIMYSKNATIIGNGMSNNHGPSGGGLGLKDVNGATIERNRFVDNQIAAQIDNSPLDPGVEHVWRDNVFAYNEAALGILPSTRANSFTGNAFIDNIQQVTVLGGGEVTAVEWSKDGRGNYWSDYAGYDANGDGVGDVPYRSQQLFENLIDRHPQLRMFMFSPAATAIDFAAKAFPSVRPRTKLEDAAPLMQPPGALGLPALPERSTPERIGQGAAGLLVAMLALGLVVTVRRRTRTVTESDNGNPHDRNGMAMTRAASHQLAAHEATDDGEVIVVRSLTKRYGRHAAVDDLNLTIARGEAVALWGPNGAGKTTLIRCLLGITRYTGDVRIDGSNPLRAGRTVRSLIGYVPQDLAPSAMTVREMASFVATLKQANDADALDRLRLLGIEDAADKQIAELSGGMRQRLALALALIGSPSILLLDEPTANLDAAGRADLLNLLRRLKRDGMTLVFSSHRPDDVLMLADRVLSLENGRLLGVVAPGEFARDMNATSRLVVSLRNGHMAEALETLAALGLRADEQQGRVLSIDIEPKQKALVLSALARNGVDIDDFDLNVEVGSCILPQ